MFGKEKVEMLLTRAETERKKRGKWERRCGVWFSSHVTQDAM